MEEERGKNKQLLLASLRKMDPHIPIADSRITAGSTVFQSLPLSSIISLYVYGNCALYTARKCALISKAPQEHCTNRDFAVYAVFQTYIARLLRLKAPSKIPGTSVPAVEVPAFLAQ